MTSPYPIGDSSTSSEGVDWPGHGRGRFTRYWVYGITSTCIAPYSQEDLEQAFASLVDQLFDAVRSSPVDEQKAAQVGKTLVEMSFIHYDSLHVSLKIVGKKLLREQELRHVPHLAQRVAVVLAALSSGHSQALRQQILDQQEDLHQAMFRAIRDLEPLSFGINTLIARAELENEIELANHGSYQRTYVDETDIAYREFAIGMYELSNGNHDEARRWLRNAVDNGIEEARPWLEACER